MPKMKDRVAILGEGPTEFYFIQSLADEFKGINIYPSYPKHTNMTELGKKIEECIALGYRYVFCMVDMDTAAKTPQYAALRRKYAEPVHKPRKGIECDVLFFETHLCTELFFLYYFEYTSKEFENQPQLIAAINRHCPYEKSEDFFRKCRGIHTYFEKHGGSLDKAIANAIRSVKEREDTGRPYTYSELGHMLLRLKEIQGR